MMNTQPNPIAVCIMGTTASGKTALALDIAKHLSTEIISVDSAAVYRNMDIGTAKPTPTEQKQIKHHLIDICDPSHYYSAANFRTDASAIIATLTAQHKTPLLVGGTMLYFHALQNGLSPLPAADPIIRAQLHDEAEVIGWPAMHARLNQIDTEAAARIQPNDAQRIQRALEVFEITGQPISLLHHHKIGASDCRFINIALIPSDRSLLRQRITQRFDQMMQQGLIEEVEQLFQRPDLNPDLPAMRTVGYKQILQYLNKTLTVDEMRERVIIATAQLAKRQLTWLKKWPRMHAFDPFQIPYAELQEQVLSLIIP